MVVGQTRLFRGVLSSLFFIIFLAVSCLHADQFYPVGGKLVGTGSLGNNIQQGTSVALSYDGSTAVVGGVYDNSFRGAAWIYFRSGSAPNLWTQQGPKLTGSNATGINFFGQGVAISDDGNTVLVAGASTNAGGWVFVRSGTNWTQQATLTSGQTSMYGTAVALSSNGNTAVVGARNDISGTGTIWVFSRTGTNWSQPGSKVGTGTTNSNLGASVSISGDGTTILAGAPSGSNAVWVFVQNAGVWSQQAVIGGLISTQFGAGVSLSSDGNTAAIGSPQARQLTFTPPTYGGGASVWGRTGTNWSVQAGSFAVLTVTSASVGTSVSLSHDGTMLVLGAPAFNTNVGQAVFYKHTTAWNEYGVSVSGSNAVGFYVLQGNSIALSGDGSIAFIGGPDDNSNVGAVWPFTAFAPIIAVQQPLGSGLTNGQTVNFGTFIPNSTPASLTFNITNIGTTNLSPLTLTIDGPNASEFVVTANPVTPVLTNAHTTFTVQFSPITTNSGLRNATLHIANNDYFQNPFNVGLSGAWLTFAADTDGDGISDAAEYQLSPLGFNWQVSQPSLVSNLMTYASSANLFTPQQVQALNVGVPLLQKNQQSGFFTLTLGLQKSTNLTSFSPFPFTSQGISVDGQGELQFQFSVPDNAAFFRLQSH